MICATPPLPLPACAAAGHLIVELLPSDQSLGTAVCRNRVKFCVVPDESERTARVIGSFGSLTPGLMDAIAELSQFVILLRRSPR